MTIIHMIINILNKIKLIESSYYDALISFVKIENIDVESLLQVF